MSLFITTCRSSTSSSCWSSSSSPTSSSTIASPSMDHRWDFAHRKITLRWAKHFKIINYWDTPSKFESNAGRYVIWNRSWTSLVCRCFSTTGCLRRSKPFKRTRCAGLSQDLVLARLQITRLQLPWVDIKVDVSTLAASCNYWRWGPGGMQENINAICVLALNMINDKVTST